MPRVDRCHTFLAINTASTSRSSARGDRERGHYGDAGAPTRSRELSIATFRERVCSVVHSTQQRTATKGNRVMWNHHGPRRLPHPAETGEAFGNIVDRVLELCEEVVFWRVANCGFEHRERRQRVVDG